MMEDMAQDIPDFLFPQTSTNQVLEITMEDFLTAKEVAQKLRVTLSTISRYVRNGVFHQDEFITPTRRGRGWRILIRRSAVERLLSPTSPRPASNNQQKRKTPNDFYLDYCMSVCKKK